MSGIASGLKRKFVEAASAEAVKLFSRCSEEVRSLVERLADSANTKREARRVRCPVEIGHPAREWIKCISSQANPKDSRALLRDLYGSARLLATDRRNGQ